MSEKLTDAQQTLASTIQDFINGVNERAVQTTDETNLDDNQIDPGYTVDAQSEQWNTDAPLENTDNDYVITVRAKRRLNLNKPGKRALSIGIIATCGVFVLAESQGTVGIVDGAARAIKASTTAAGDALPGQSLFTAEENVLADAFNPTTYCGDIVGTVELDATTPIYWGLNVVDSESERTKSAEDSSYKPNAHMYFIAPEDVDVPGGRTLEHDDINLLLPEIPFASKEQIKDGEMIARYPMAGIINTANIMVCQDNSGGASPTEGVAYGMSVDRSKYSLNALIPDIGQTGAADNAVMGYEGFKYSNDENADGFLPNGEVERFNQSIVAPDNPDTPKREDSRDPFVMNALHYMARKTINTGACKQDVRTIADQSIVKDLQAQANEQGIEESLEITFTGDYIMPAAAYDAALLDPKLRTPDNAILDENYMKEHATCSDPKPVDGINIIDDLTVETTEGDR